jgi:transposase
MQPTPPTSSHAARPHVLLAQPDMAGRVGALEQQNGDLSRKNGQLSRENETLRRQVAWFQRQLFGQKSERRMPEPQAQQGVLGEAFNVVPDDLPPAPTTPVAGHARSSKPRHGNGNPDADDAALFFDDKKVPIEVITIAHPDIAGLREDQYTVISEKVSFRLAQRPGSYVILKYVRPVIKRHDTRVLSCPPLPDGIFARSRADVSFLVGMIIDKLAYHLPLYRQHQRLRAAGIQVSRSWLTQCLQGAASLLEPIHDAQLLSIRAARVKAMDETPIKAGPTGTGKMKAAYFWPVYGELDEICFLYYPSRSAIHVQEALGLTPPDGAVLQSDGYAAYAQYAKKTGVRHAQCWAHGRRKLFDARDLEPELADQALDWIGQLYAAEAHIRDHNLQGVAKRAWRQARAKPACTALFAWIDKQFEAQGFLPGSPFTTALAYLRERRAGLEIYLDDPDVPIDTNHLERALRVIPMGKKNWLFSWSELGAKQIGILQSLLVTCRLHDIDPYTYLVDVLQRIDRHPAAEVHTLTPRLWKQHFADQPLRSALDGRGTTPPAHIG